MPPKYSPHSDSRSDSLERSRSKKSKKSKKNKKEKKKKKSKKREKSTERPKSPGTPVVDDHKEDNNGHEAQEEQGTPTIDEKPTTPTKLPPKTNTPPSAQRASQKPEEKNGEEPKYTIDKTVYPYKPDFEP